MGRTIPSFEMVIGEEIERLMRTFGKKLSSKQEKMLLNQTLQLCEKYSYACSTAVKLIPSRSIFVAILLDQQKTINSLMQKFEELQKD